MVFLIDTFKRNNWKLFEKQFTTQISMRNRGAINEQEIAYNSFRLNGDMHEGLSNACKIGYLEMTGRSKGWLSFLS